MATLANLVVNMVGDSTKLVKASQRAKRELSGLTETTKKVARGGLLAGGALIGGAAVGATVLFNSARNSLDVTGKFASQLGVTATQARALQFVAEQGAININTLRRGIRNAARNLEQFQRGQATPRVTESLEALGITSTQAGKALRGGPIEAFKLIAERIEKMGMETARADRGTGGLVARMRLFEQTGLDKTAARVAARTSTMAQAMAAYEDQFGDANRETRKIELITGLLGDRFLEARPALENFGAVFGQATDQINAFGGGALSRVGDVETLNDTMFRASQAVQLVGESLITALARPFTAIVLATQAWLEQLVAGQGGIDTLATTVTENVVGGLTTMLEVLDKITLAWNAIKEAIAFVKEGIEIATTALKSFLGFIRPVLDIFAGRLDRLVRAGGAAAGGDVLGAGRSLLGLDESKQSQGLEIADAQLEVLRRLFRVVESSEGGVLQ